ncbi:MAG: hypothetical protein ACRENG_23685 [bacterium]
MPVNKAKGLPNRKSVEKGLEKREINSLKITAWLPKMVGLAQRQQTQVR